MEVRQSGNLEAKDRFFGKIKRFFHTFCPFEYKLLNNSTEHIEELEIIVIIQKILRCCS